MRPVRRLRTGHSHVCQKLKFIGIDAPGAMQGLWTVPAHTLHRLPDNLTLEHASLAEPIAAPPSYATSMGMEEPTARKYSNFDDMKADEYRYWQSLPAHERLDAVDEMIETAYALKGWEMKPDVPRLQRPFVRLPCPWR
jgi:hypothetical protein